MTGFLAEIVGAVREDVRSGAYGRGLPQRPSGRRASLRAAIDRDRTQGAVLVEFKRASPGQEDPRLPARTVEEFVRRVEPARPTAFSCLATRPRFDGSPRDVADLARCTERPVLFKEFVVADEQIESAARAGASAVLLIARLADAGLLDRPLAELADKAHDVGLEVLLELHRSAELSWVDGVRADVFGVNVRDLDTLRFARPTAVRTLADARAAGLKPLVGLSGVTGPAEAKTFWDAGADGLLVGTAIARAEDPAEFVRSLRSVREGGGP